MKGTSHVVLACVLAAGTVTDVQILCAGPDDDSNEYYVDYVMFNTEGKLIASGHDDGVIRVWDQSTRSYISNLKGLKLDDDGMACSPDGMIFVAGSRSGADFLWNVASGKRIAKFQGHLKPVTAVIRPSAICHPPSSKNNRLFRFKQSHCPRNLKHLT